MFFLIMEEDIFIRLFNQWLKTNTTLKTFVNYIPFRDQLFSSHVYYMLLKSNGDFCISLMFLTDHTFLQSS
jgi:hypothetical protein